MQSSGSRWFTRRWVLLAVAVVVVVGGGAGIWFATHRSSTTSATSTVQTVATGTITQSVSTSGTIEPSNQASLNFGVAGRVTAVDVTAGQTVTAGQILATLDPTTLSATEAQAQASLTAEQSKLATDQDDGASSAQIAADQASVASLQAQLTSAQTDLADATLTASIAGQVSAVNLSVGQQVSAGSSTTGTTTTTSAASTTSTGSSGFGASSSTGSSANSSSSSSSSTAQVAIVSTGSYIVNTTVDDTEVSEVKVGDQAVITPSGATTNVFGTVASIGALASTSTGVASFPVVINVTGSPSGLYGGASATVAITVKQLADVVVVPTTAIHYNGNATTINVITGGSTVARTVTVGTASAGDTQIVSGVSVGDRIEVPVVTFGRFGGAGRTGAGGFPGGGFTGGGGFSGGTGGFTGGGGGFGG